MIESRRQAYLEAMGLDVWVMKPAPSLLDRLVLRPGEGGTLLLCSQPEDTAGRRMQTEFIAVPPFWTVGQAIDHLRADEDLPDRFTEIFTIDHRFKLVGTVPLDRLLRAEIDCKTTGMPAELICARAVLALSMAAPRRRSGRSG